MTGYTPVLLDKRAELDALAELSTGARSMMTPLLTIRPPTPPERPQGRWNPLGRLLDRILNSKDGIVECWGTTAPLMIDLSQVEPEYFDEHDHPVDAFFEVCEGVGVSAIPVIGRTQPSTHRASVARAARRLENGACIRLTHDDLGTGTDGLRFVIRELDMPRASLDLCADFGDIHFDNGFMFSRVAAECLRQFEPLQSWRSVTISASSFPAELYKRVDNQTQETLPRLELDIWRRLRAMDESLERIRFGDYGIVPARPEPGFRGAANLRYTLPNRWLVLRGPHRDEAGVDDYLRLAETLVGVDSWKGAGHCSGCTFIEKQLTIGRPGNPTQWRQAAFAHHMETVVETI